MEAPKQYTIIVQDTYFVLSDDQICRDGPNYFTNYFGGSFKEAQDGVQVMVLSRDPYLFTFICMYLRGYHVLPLPDENIPWYLSKESRLKNLLADAYFYGLNSLAEEIEAAVRLMQAHSLRREERAQPKKDTWKI